MGYKPRKYLEKHANEMDDCLYEVLKNFYEEGKRSKSSLQAKTTFYDHISRFRSIYNKFAPPEFDPRKPSEEELVDLATKIEEFEDFTPDTKESAKKAIKTVYREYKGGEYYEQTEAFHVGVREEKASVEQHMILSTAEIREIVSNARHPRTKAFIRLMYETATTPGELLQNRLMDVNLEEETIYVRGNGTHESQTMELHSAGVKYLREYLKMHPAVDNPFSTNKDEPLWIKFQGQDCKNCGNSEIRHRDQRYSLDCEEYIPEKIDGVGYRTVYNAFKNAVERTSIERNIQPKYLRKSMLTHINEEAGISSESLNSFARWKLGSSQAEHYVSISNQKVRNVVKETFKDGETSEEELVVCENCDSRNPADRVECKFCHRPLNVAESQKMSELGDIADKISSFSEEELSKLKEKAEILDNPEEVIEKKVEQRIEEKMKEVE